MAAKDIQGTDLLLSFEGKAIGCARTSTFSSSFEMVDAACKEAGKFYTATPGKVTATLSSDGVVKIDTPVDATAMRSHDIALLHLNQTLINWEFTTGVAGEFIYAGQGYINSFELNAPDGEAATYSCGVQVVDEWTIGTVAA
jgi:hypothetical protein